MEDTLNEIRSSFGRGAFRNEEHIRVAVVCRLLQQLGWDIWNPDEVNLEFVCVPDEDRTKVDIALFSTVHQPDAFIEVKGHGMIRGKLGDIERQLRDYNRNNTALFSIITDGAEWRFYYSQTGGEFSKKCFKVLNLLRDGVDDLHESFRSLLKKSEIQNGTAEQLAISYLRLTQKQRVMEDLLPDARRKAMEAPYPSLPSAMVELVSEQGVEVTQEEAITFISEFQDRRPVITTASPVPPKSLPQLNSPTRNPAAAVARVIDLKSPGDLRFTKITDGKLGFETAKTWISLVKVGLKLALGRGHTVHELQRKLSINLKSEAYGEEGYAWDNDLRLSIQGFDTKKGVDNLHRLALLLNEEVYVRFYWRENDGAAHPGEEGIIHWRP